MALFQLVDTMMSQCYVQQQQQAWLKMKVTLILTQRWWTSFEKKEVTWIVWMWFGYKRSDEKQTTLICRKCMKIVTTKGGNTTPTRSVLSYLQEYPEIFWCYFKAISPTLLVWLISRFVLFTEFFLNGDRNYTPLFYFSLHKYLIHANICSLQLRVAPCTRDWIQRCC